MSKFILEPLEDGTGRVSVKNNENGWFFPAENEYQAQFICDKLNELQELADEKPLDLHEDFEKWDNLIDRVDKNSRRLLEIKEIYQVEGDRLLEEARELKIDFKALYGGNNATTRKQYVDEQLSDLLNEKKELEFTVSNDKRRIDFLKKYTAMKIELIKIGVGE